MKRLEKGLQRYGEIIFLTFLTIFSLIMFLNSFTIQGFSSATDKMGPSIMPKAVFGLMMILSVFLLVDYFRYRRAAIREKVSTSVSEEKQKEKRESSKRGIISVVGIFGFLLLVQKLGFFLTATAYLIFEFFMLEPRRNVKKMILLAVLAVVFSGAVYYLFRYRVYVRLPKGIWG
jgi:membrane protein YdbS with pleckstrin-like domain